MSETNSDSTLTTKGSQPPQPDDSTRSRTFTWHDPLALAEAARTTSGIEMLRALVEGKLPPPPFAAMMNIWLAEVSEGRVVFATEPGEYHYNPIGSVHGGVVATLLDSAMGCAVHSMLPAGVGYTTLEIKVNYVRPLTRDTGPVRCEGTVIHLGGKIATAEGRLTDAVGKLYAHATTTCLILRD